MRSQQDWAVLNAPPNIEEARKRTVHTLDSRFPVFHGVEIDNLESLVAEARQRDVSLQSKLALSRHEITAVLAGARLSADTNLHTASELSLLRHSLTDDLSELIPELISTLTNDELNATLLESTETLHRGLKELQSIKGYVQVIGQALRLSESSIEHIRGLKSDITEASLNDYQVLRRFVYRVSEACSTLAHASEEQNLHLVTFLEQICVRTWRDLQDILSVSLIQAAEIIGWPMPIDYLSSSPDARNNFEQAFRNLLKFQKLGENHQPQKLGATNALYALQALVQPVSLRFKYHFDGKRQTNRLDKPEWYFTHILNVAHDHQLFMTSVVQRLLSSSDYAKVDAWLEFTTLLLSILSRKLKQTMPSLLQHPPLLAHTIHQALLFDTALAEEGFSSQRTSATLESPAVGWRGLSDVILGNIEWFDTWLRGEREFAEDQYHDIINSADAWSVEGHEDSRSKELKSTNSARRLCSLIEQVTDRYSPLPDFIQRIRFLRVVQLPLLDQYHGRILSSLDAFEAFSSAFIKAVPGAFGVTVGGREEAVVHLDSQGLTSGVSGVQRLGKALLSAKYIEVSLHKWGDELFFVELWTAVNQNPNVPDHTTPTQPALSQGPESDKEDLSCGTFFDALISHYEKLVNRAEDMIVHQVCGEVERALKVHFAADISSDENLERTNDIALPQSLFGPVALLSSHLTFLGTILSSATLTPLYRRIASRLAEYLFQRQIMHHRRLTLQDGKRFYSEYQLWVESCQVALRGTLGDSKARVETPWIRLLQAGRLLSAEGDVWTAILDATFGMQSEDEWERTVYGHLSALQLEREDVAKILQMREDCDR